jgi:hypothetical protein
MVENYVTGTSKYPESPEVVLRILGAYTPAPGWNRHLKQEGGGRDEGAMFVQSDRGDGSWKNNILCHNCGKKGHLCRKPIILYHTNRTFGYNPYSTRGIFDAPG